MRLMKSVTMILMALATTLVVGCGKDSKGDGYSNNGDVVAFVPTPEACMRQPTTLGSWSTYQNYGFQQCNWNAYQQYDYGQYNYGYGRGRHSRHGQQGYGYQPGYPNSYSQASCGCPSGYQPVCDGGLGGMVCMPIGGSSYLNSMIYWGWNNQSQFSYYAGYNRSNWNNAYASPFGQSCMVGTNSCGYGYCQPLQAGSSIGYCVR